MIFCVNLISLIEAWYNLIFSEKRRLNKNDVIDGWDTIILAKEWLSKDLLIATSIHMLIAGSGGCVTISHPPGSQGNGHQFCGLAVNTQ